QVRRATLALAREVERRAPELATSKWWKEERHGVFLDYNQNAKDRTVASAWSVRPTPDARVSMPLEWDEVAGCDPATFTLVTAPARLAERGGGPAAIDAAPGSLDRLLGLSAALEAAGPGELAACPRERARRRGGARPRLRSLARCRPGAARVAGAEDALQLVGRCDLQLIVAAVPWLLVRAPAHELRGVAKASALHVIVSDLADALGPQRLPAEILPPVPAAARARHALPGRARLGLSLRPVAPGMALERVR